jgi:hypothetical protein
MAVGRAGNVPSTREPSRRIDDSEGLDAAYTESRVKHSERVVVGTDTTRGRGMVAKRLILDGLLDLAQLVGIGPGHRFGERTRRRGYLGHDVSREPDALRHGVEVVLRVVGLVGRPKITSSGWREVVEVDLGRLEWIAVAHIGLGTQCGYTMVFRLRHGRQGP